MKSKSKTMHVVVAAGILGLLISGFAVAKTGDALRAGQKVTSGTDKQTVLKTNNDKTGFNGYGFRVQNKSTKNGGGALMSCYTPDAGCFYGTNKSSTGGPGVKARSDKGVPLDIFNADTTKAPMTVNSSVKVDNLHANNSDQLGGQGPDRYGSAAALVLESGALSTEPVAFGIYNVVRAELGIYVITMPSALTGYVFQVTAVYGGENVFCKIGILLVEFNQVAVFCRDPAAGYANSNFYFTAIKP